MKLLNGLLLWLTVIAILIMSFLFYSFRSSNNLNVDPHATEVIEKAKQR